MSSQEQARTCPGCELLDEIRLVMCVVTGCRRRHGAASAVPAAASAANRGACARHAGECLAGPSSHCVLATSSKVGADMLKLSKRIERKLTIDYVCLCCFAVSAVLWLHCGLRPLLGHQQHYWVGRTGYFAPSETYSLLHRPQHRLMLPISAMCCHSQV